MVKISSKFRNIILTGMPGSGKTRFGKVYAIFTQRTFIDFDSYIEQHFKKSISEIFTKYGEEEFRNIESKYLKKLIKRNDCVIALGGGTLLKSENFQLAIKIGLIVNIEAPNSELAKRIMADKKKRPLFQNCDSLESHLSTLDEMLEKRSTVYNMADVQLNSYTNSLNTMCLFLAQREKKSLNKRYLKEVNAILNQDFEAFARTYFRKPFQYKRNSSTNQDFPKRVQSEKPNPNTNNQ